MNSRLVLELPLATMDRSRKKKRKKDRIQDESRPEEVFVPLHEREEIEGSYIPKNLKEALEELDKQLNSAEKKQLLQPLEEDLTRSLYRGIGMSMRNSWGLWQGSRLQVYFKDRGESWPDNIAAIILEQYLLWNAGQQDCWEKWEAENPVVGG